MVLCGWCTSAQSGERGGSEEAPLKKGEKVVGEVLRKDGEFLV